MSDQEYHYDVLIVGGKFKQVRGLEVNETDVTCYPNLGALQGNASTVGGVPFLQAVRAGLFDRAIITRQRAFLTSWADTTVSMGAVTLFLGEVTDSEITRNQAILKCKDATNLLNIYMPRRQYQPHSINVPCGHVLKIVPRIRNLPNPLHVCSHQ